MFSKSCLIVAKLQKLVDSQLKDVNTVLFGYRVECLGRTNWVVENSHEYGTIDDKKVTHWMYVPDPPQDVLV